MSDPQQPAGPSGGPAGAGWPEEEDSQSGTPTISAFNRIWKVLVAPQDTFRAIAARPTWGLLFVVSVVLTFAVWFLLVPKIDFAESLRQQMEQQGRELPAGAEGKMAGIMKISTLVGAGIAPMVLPLLFAAYYLLFNLLGGRIRFRTSLSVILHAGVPALIKLLLSLPVALSRQSLTLEEAQSQLLKSNLAAFAPEDVGKQLYLVLSSVDVFSFWCLFLLIIGYSIAANVSKKVASGLVLASWGAVILILVLLAGLRPS